MDIGSAGEQIPSLDSQDSQYESDIKPDLMETSTNNGNSDGGPNQGQKRQAESDKNSGQGNQNQQKRMRTDTYNNGNNKLNGNKNIKCELRVLLPSKDAGAIIGRAGANIKKLRTEHKTIIQVPDCDGPERLLLVAGETETCLATILDVLPLLEEFNTGNATEFRLLVHQSQAGCIIGKSGDKIKELRLKHSLDMKVYSECAPMSTERICQMRGKAQDIVNCLGDVLALLETAPPKGMNRPYDPHNFNEFLSSQYGGYTSEKRQGMGGGGGGGGSGMGGGGGRGMGFGGRGGGRGGSLGGGSFNNGGSGNFGGGQGGGRGGFNQRGGGSFGGPTGGGGFNQGLNDQNGSGGGGGGMGGGRGGGMRGGGGFGQRAGNGNGMSRGGFSSRGRGGQTDMSRTGGRGGGGGGLGGGSSFVPRGGGRGGGLGGGSFGGQGGGGGGGGGGFNAGGMGPNQGGGGGGGGGGGFQQHHQSQSSLNASGQNPNAITNQVTIPNELAGAIIGPKGSKIQQIRESSGAGITIDKPISGSNDRIITITGTPEQIQNAQYLLQMTVKQSGLWHGQ